MKKATGTGKSRAARLDEVLPEYDFRRARRNPYAARYAAATGTIGRARRRRLEAAGFRVGSTADFLELSPDEAALVEMKAALAGRVREWRMRAGITQAALAQRLGSSQSRVAKLEAGDPSVSLELLVRASIAAGASRREVARVLGG